MRGYQKIVGTIYSPKQYSERIFTFLKEYRKPFAGKKMEFSRIGAFFLFVLHLGITEKSITARWYCWKTLLVALFKYRRAFPETVTLLIWGVHFRKVAEGIAKARQRVLRAN